MGLVEIEPPHEGVVTIAMNRPKANALNRDLIHELQSAFDAAAADENARAIILTSRCPGFFSVGLDVNEVFDYDRDTMRALWFEFSNLYRGVHACPKPVVAALPGHTFAGGIILALACDLRVMLDGKFGLGVSGINIGLPLPMIVMRLAALAVGLGPARHLFLSGETITPAEALQIGMVRSLHDDEPSLHEAAEHWARVLGSKSPRAFQTVRRMFDDLAGGIPETTDPEDVNRFLDLWFSEEAAAERARVRASVGR
jgi:enoyl-CoA hydratase/carnithine racemase